MSQPSMLTLRRTPRPSNRHAAACFAPMSSSCVRLLFLACLCCLCLTVSARVGWGQWPFSYLFSQPKPEANSHPIPRLKIKELPAPDAPPKNHWFSASNKDYHSALLIAGSHGYENYRHQADVCHAYRILRERGLKDEKIVTFVYDDIAYNEYNPYPGQLFNSPGGFDVYPGCAKDYTGKDVNSYTVLAVLTGRADLVRGIGSGRVLIPHPGQRVFMFYSDHGSAGILHMPVGPPLSAKTLNKAIVFMHNNDFFDELVFYLEACESGSIFRGFGYGGQWKILAVSASSPFESSYGAYCPSKFKVTEEPSPNTIGTCMGDLFSVSWMEFTEYTDCGLRTIDNQLGYTYERTISGGDKFTGHGGSGIEVYGPKDLPIYDEVIGNFLSYFDVPSGLTKLDAFPGPHLPGEENKVEELIDQDKNMTIEQRDADLVFLMRRSMSNDVEVKNTATKELQYKLQKRQEADTAIRSVIQTLMDGGLLKNEKNRGVEEYAMELFPRGEDQQIVEDWDCFEGFVDVWFQKCGRMDSYSQQYTRTFANLCNAGIEVPAFAQAAAKACTTNEVT